MLTDNAVVMGDTENHRSGEGYERVLIFAKWDPNDDRRLAKVHIRVDRSPVMSYAWVHVWVPSAGWQFVTGLGPEKWWNSMPGYQRGQTTNADREMLNLADDLLDTLVEIGI